MSFDDNKCLEFLRDELAVQEANYKEIVETNAKKLLQEGEHLFRGKIIKISESQIFIKFRAEFGILRINSTRYLCHFLKEEGRVQYVVFLYTLFYFYLIINSCCSGSGFQPGGSFFRG